jgi:hypothetical protein
MAGDQVNAKKAYEGLFATWKNADADLPPLMAASKDTPRCISSAQEFLGSA